MQLRDEIELIAKWLREHKGKVPINEWYDKQKLMVEKLRELARVGDVPGMVDEPVMQIETIKPGDIYNYLVRAGVRSGRRIF